MRITSEQKIAAWTSTPMANIMQYDNDHGYLRKFHMALFKKRCFDERGAVQYMKDLLGKQDYCWTGSRRYWIWEGRTEGIRWRVFANNERGIDIEISEYSTVDMCKTVLRDFKRAFKIR